MPKILIDGARVIIDHVPGSTDRATWSDRLIANTSWRSVAVTSYPPSFHIGHVLSSDGLSATLVGDEHEITKIQTRRHKVQGWAAGVSLDMAVYREAAIGTAMAAAFFDYRLMMLSAAMDDRNLSNDVVWDVIDAGLVSFQTFMGYTWARWTRTSIREAMREGRTFYKMSETGDPADSQNTLRIPVSESSIRMTSISSSQRARL